MTANNVLILMSDEHTRSVMGAYGNALVKTPALDRLAASGVRFDNAYTPSPICIPARASFATGTQVFEHRCWSSAEPYYGQHQSWMQRLRAEGHPVVAIGKQHYRSAQDDTGFSEQILPMYLANDGKGWPQGLQRKPMAEFPDAEEMARLIGPGETSYTQYDRDITAAAVEWLHNRSAAAGKPWVLFVSFICPHFPLSAPQQFYDLYRDVELPAPYDRDASERLRHPVIDQMREFWDYADYFNPVSEIEGLRNYYGLCSFLDDNIRQVLDALQNTGLADSTTTIYTSDHGDMIGNHGIWGKSYMYEDSVGIPMTLSGPGIGAGSNDTPVSLTDLAATVERAVGDKNVKSVADWQSRPLQDFVLGPEPERPVLSEYHDGGSPSGFYMLRQGPWKYVHFAEGHPVLLFNIDEDPRELRNLADDAAYGKIASALRQQLLKILDPEAVNRQAFADQAEKIEELGGVDAIRKMPSFNHTPLDPA
ncbi:MAG: sulfatase-like hydrolase/transferase [Gammaproteobacteria bacterium]|nr:sulfatase-like hydrolase/transferase [Gammaproteobacteria bacterium]